MMARKASPSTAPASESYPSSTQRYRPVFEGAGFGNTVPLSWDHMETWELLERLLGARPPVAPQQAAQRNESFTLKFVWLRDHIRQMPLTDDLETLRQYARCYIILLVGGHLMTDKSNNLVHLRWLPLFQDFGRCRACLGDRPYWPGLLLRFSQFIWTSYDDPVLQALCPPWFIEEDECGTCMSLVPLVCFNVVQFHQVDRVKWQFNGEQQVPGTTVKLNYYNHHMCLSQPHQISYICLFLLTAAGGDVLILATGSPFSTRWTIGRPRSIMIGGVGLAVLGTCQARRFWRIRGTSNYLPTRDRGAREHRPGEGIRREKVRPRRAQQDVKLDEEAGYDRHEDHGDIP
ncbi:hypothetical protein Ahy_B05g075992 [Arachis hypogaea]|uniref:Aminotransferase-like plant mobile domain-containing protein n=1 Tax=Arachis hypogaea TaxID=3818 RepID=A0A444Z2E2_ARAHY|nr:hypothetical protein Ahy_B05g075992 [Arachis hypogaea]